MGIALGVLADLLLADPRRGHPVAGFGRFAGAIEGRIYGASRARGVAFAATTLAGPLAVGVLAERAASRHPAARVGLTALATWTAVGGTSLAREGVIMAGALERGDIAAARGRLGHLCARDPADLDEQDLARATVESLAENASDAVVAPLLWAAVAGVPGVLVYRAANTLDAMVGYTSPRYRRFGWAAARLDDVVNLVPARLTGALTAACAAFVGGSPAASWRTLRRDGGRHPSPNAGRCEAAAAGALGIRLGGTNAYGGHLDHRPVIGDGRAPQVADVRRAVRLGRAVGLAATSVAVGLAVALPRWSGGRT